MLPSEINWGLCTVVVAVERMYKHPKYHKMLKARSKFMAHDELDEFKVFIVDFSLAIMK
jgi:ribosomal protein S17